jgi:hypothetical protein
VALASRLFFWTDWGAGGELLGLPKIVYNGVTINFPEAPTLYHYRRRSDREFGTSGGGVAGTQLHHQYDQIRLEMQNFDSAAFEQALHPWWSWAVRGKPYAFALDDSETADTTLDGAAAAGQKVIPLTSTTGITVGKQYVIRELAGHEEELVTIASISAGVSVTAVDNLVFGYLAGDLFRSRDYFPKLVSLDDEFPVRQRITTWELSHEAREDLG